MKDRPRRSGKKAGFSLIEVVIVVTILGVITSIAAPRVSSAGSRASAAALEATVGTVRRAIDVYYAEHGRFPGYDPTTKAADHTSFAKQLIGYTSHRGAVGEKLVAPYLFGPYLRGPFPVNPLNKLNTVYVKAKPADADPPADAYGWIAVLSTGDFGVHATDAQLDDMGFDDSTRRAKVRQ